MTPHALATEIINRLRVSPRSIEELAEEIPASGVSIKLLVSSLLRCGELVKVEGRDDEGAPVYALVGYTEPPSWGDHSDIILGYDYGSFYEQADELD